MNLRSFLFILNIMFPLLIFSQERDSVMHSSLELDSIFNMTELSVYARRADEIVPSQRLGGKRLETLSTHSVADALRYFSGVQIKDYGGVGGLKTIDIRSMGTNHMGVFYDGIQLGNAQNGLVDLGRFSLENVEEIALYNGQKAQIFQPARDFGTSGSEKTPDVTELAFDLPGENCLSFRICTTQKSRKPTQFSCLFCYLGRKTV